MLLDDANGLFRAGLLLPEQDLPPDWARCAPFLFRLIAQARPASAAAEGTAAVMLLREAAQRLAPSFVPGFTVVPESDASAQDIGLVLAGHPAAPGGASALLESWRARLAPDGVLVLAGAGLPDPGDLPAPHELVRLGGEGQGVVVLGAGTSLPEALRGLFAEDRAALETFYARLGEGAAACQHVARMTPRLRMLERGRADARAEAAQLRRALETATARQADAAARLAVIEGSPFWRATAPLRAALARLPAPLRRPLRRVVRLAMRLLRPPVRALRRLRGAASPARAALATPTTVRTGLGFAFTPLPAAPDAPPPLAAAAGRYAVTDAPAGYVYVAPRRPEDIAARIACLARRPRFSIVVPAYNTGEDLLARMAGSVRAQWYPHWQLIVADDASPDAATAAAIAALPERTGDPRIETFRLAANAGISGATNAAIARAQGDYVVFLDHDDELTEDCLYELAVCIAREDADFVYSDEDKIAPDGQFAQPFFKPDWSPDTMMSTMYTCHVCCVRRALLDGVGLLRPEFDGSQDYDFVLRLVEHARVIRHIPKVLYHWRIIPASLAASLDAKPQAVDAARRARLAAIARRGLDGWLEPVAQVPGYFNTAYGVRGTPLISIVIPTRDNLPVLARCIASILEQSTWRHFEIVVMDNGATDLEPVAALCRDAGIACAIVPYPAPFNFAAINNAALARARGEILLFLNDDTEVATPDWLERMAGYAQLAHIGAVGAKLLYPGTLQVQHNGILNLADGPRHAFLDGDADDPGYFMRNLLEYNWLAVTGACLMIERAKFDAAGRFDEAFPLAYNDVELCFRLIDRGLFNVCCPRVRLLHHESLSRGRDVQDGAKRMRLARDMRRLYEAYPHYFLRDPFHNPNLSPVGTAFELAAD